MGKIIRSLDDHEAYDLVPLTSVPRKQKVIISRFVFKQKADDIPKARLVVQGHFQDPGIAYGK